MSRDAVTGVRVKIRNELPETELPRGSGLPQSPGALVSYLRRTALRPVLPRSWDPMMYSCLAAGVATVLACSIFPKCTELAVFTWLMFFTSGPTSTFLPSASEPLLMAFGKLYPPLALAGLGVVGIALVEWVNYRVFSAVVHNPRLTPVRSARVTRRITACFAIQPFVTTAVAALTPMPFWMVRICGVLARYPMPRFILATAIGRFPRIWLFAFLGTALPFSGSAILLGGGVVILVGAVVAASKRKRLASGSRVTPVPDLLATTLP